MLSYDEFKEELKRVILEQATEEERDCVRFGTVTKAHAELDTVGICNEMGAYRGGPCIYLNDIYNHYRAGNNLECEAESVLATLRRTSAGSFELPDFTWDYVKGRLILQLVAKTDNDAFFRGIPHREYLDLIVIYRVVIDKSHGGTTTCVVTNGLMERIGVTEEELFRTAYQMTPVIMPPRLCTMYEVMREMAGRMPEEGGEGFQEALESLAAARMWVVTDVLKQMGAYLLMYPEVFRDLSGEDEDLYIIPSSIHELIAIPASVSDSRDSIADMIHEVNITAVPVDEVLSDSLYRYDAKENKIVIA